MLPFLLSPDDYVRERIGTRHIDLMLDGLAGAARELRFDSSRLRDTGTPDMLTQAAPDALPLYFKQPRMNKV